MSSFDVSMIFDNGAKRTGTRVSFNRLAAIDVLMKGTSVPARLALDTYVADEKTCVVAPQSLRSELEALFGRLNGDVTTIFFDDNYSLNTGVGLSQPVIDPDLISRVSQYENVLLIASFCLPETSVLRAIREYTSCNVKTLYDLFIGDSTSPVWSAIEQNIYPIDIPEIVIESGLDLLIIDCPSRNLSMMPNGLGYVANALSDTEVNFQILDLDIISYHRFHMHRIFDMAGSITLPGGRTLPTDPWQAEHYDLWSGGGGGVASLDSELTSGNEVIDLFLPVIDEFMDALRKAPPKLLGFSIQGCNEAFSTLVAKRVKREFPEILIVVGGFSCYNPEIGFASFPLADYMFIGESDATVGPVIEKILKSIERPRNQPGVLSKFDDPELPFIPAPMIHDLDTIPFPKYDWLDLSLYRNYNDYQLTPVIASRGCRWSRCTFCAERFYWRIRSAPNFVDELEWLADNGCHLFMFNESDLGGMPERVLEICDEVIRRGLHRRVKLTGQLRVNKLQDRAFFEKLREANFVALRFGVDAFSANTLKLQKKGYTVEMIKNNLRDCWESGIFTEVNWVIGVPGETESDVEEGIDLILECQKWIGRLANINPLILVNGSVYWIDPESFGIEFREPREILFEKYPRALPADSWYSTEPFIDASIRKRRFERIIVSLHDKGFHIGDWAQKIIDEVKSGRDKNRSTGAEAHLR